jgi:hypothetical protein
VANVLPLCVDKTMIVLPLLPPIAATLACTHQLVLDVLEILIATNGLVLSVTLLADALLLHVTRTMIVLPQLPHIAATLDCTHQLVLDVLEILIATNGPELFVP